jgi:hypothetical protein
MDFELLKQKILANEFELTQHAHEERQAENIEAAEIKEAILTGGVLEDYPNDPRGASCLILGYAGGRAIHVVCGWSPTGWARVITVYLPMPSKWVDERTRRKEKNNGS